MVTTVKQNAKLFAEDHNCDLLLVDGPPGIGCPVISASAGATLALLVAEPGVSGLHDLERIIKTLEQFNVPILICINKANLFPSGVDEIRRLAQTNAYSIAGEVPFDDAIPKAMLAAQPVTLFAPESPSALAIRQIWNNIQRFLFGES